MEIPDSITVNTGEDAGIHKNIERFFLEAISEIEKKVGVKESPLELFKIDHLNLCKLTPLTPQASDDYAHVLSYKERVVAVVLETRTQGNYIHFDYFFNSKPL